KNCGTCVSDLHPGLFRPRLYIDMTAIRHIFVVIRSEQAKPCQKRSKQRAHARRGACATKQRCACCKCVRSVTSHQKWCGSSLVARLWPVSSAPLTTIT